MSEFTARLNIENFKAQLLTSTDEIQKITLRKLLKEEKQHLNDMMMAKRDGLDDAEPRTAESTTPTSFRQWCEEVLKPSVDADR